MAPTWHLLYPVGEFSHVEASTGEGKFVPFAWDKPLLPWWVKSDLRLRKAVRICQVLLPPPNPPSYQAWSSFLHTHLLPILHNVWQFHPSPYPAKHLYGLTCTGKHLSIIADTAVCHLWYAIYSIYTWTRLCSISGTFVRAAKRGAGRMCSTRIASPLDWAIQDRQSRKLDGYRRPHESTSHTNLKKCDIELWSASYMKIWITWDLDHFCSSRTKGLLLADSQDPLNWRLNDSVPVGGQVFLQVNQMPISYQLVNDT